MEWLATHLSLKNTHLHTFCGHAIALTEFFISFVEEHKMHSVKYAPLNCYNEG